jgi:hypothetical protein
MQLYRLIYFSLSALHVSGNVFAHHQEHLILFTVSGSIHPSCCWLVSWMSFNSSKLLLAGVLDEFQLIQDTSRQQLGWILPDTVNTVKRSWWWAKTSHETSRANKEKWINLYSCILLVTFIIHTSLCYGLYTLYSEEQYSNCEWINSKIFRRRLTISSR